MTKRVCRLTVDVGYDDSITDAESIASALDTLLSSTTTALEQQLLDALGNPRVGEFEVLLTGEEDGE